MKLMWSANGGGYIERDGVRAQLTVAPVLPFAFDAIYYDPDAGRADKVIGSGTIKCSDTEKAQVVAYLQAFIARVPTASETLAKAQAAQVEVLRQACSAAIVSGFKSTALGVAGFTYPSMPIDQSNLIGAVTASQSPSVPAGWTVNFWCADSTELWARRAHTAAQIQMVLADGVAVRVGYSARLDTLVQQVNAALTVAEAQAIVW